MGSKRRMLVTLDSGADAAYITLSDSRVAETVEVTDSVFVDLDDVGVVVGVEVLGLGTNIPFEQLRNRYHVHSEVIDRLQLIKPSVGSFSLSSTSGSDNPVATGEKPLAGALG